MQTFAQIGSVFDANQQAILVAQKSPSFLGLFCISETIEKLTFIKAFCLKRFKTTAIVHCKTTGL